MTSLLEGGVGGVDGHACEDRRHGFPDRRGRRDARRRGGGDGRAGRAAARPDRHPPLRGDGLAGARARRPPRGRLRRPRPRAVRPGATRATTATSASPTTCWRCSTTAASTRAVLAGASMGAHTLMQFALAHPERVAGLVIMTPAYDPETATPADGALGPARRRPAQTAASRASSRPTARPNVPEKWLETIDRVLHQRLVRPRAPRRAGRRAAGRPALAPVRGLGATCSAIDAPTVIVASRDEVDPEHPYAIGERYAEAIPNARLVSEERGRLAARLAGRAGLEGDQRGGGAAAAAP